MPVSYTHLGPLISPGKEKGLSGEIVDAYDIKISSLDQLIMNLSGGNQQKAIIGRSMFCHPKVLVFDEPTKGIDVGTKTCLLYTSVQRSRPFCAFRWRTACASTTENATRRAGSGPA